LTQLRSLIKYEFNSAIYAYVTVKYSMNDVMRRHHCLKMRYWENRYAVNILIENLKREN